jgi:hypothetical protein
MKLKTSLETGVGVAWTQTYPRLEFGLDTAGFIPHGPASTAGYPGYFWNTGSISDQIIQVEIEPFGFSLGETTSV